MLKKFFSYYKPYKKMFVLDLLASFFISVIGMTYPIITDKMLNDFIPNKQLNFIILFGISLAGCYFIRMLLRYFVQYYGHVIGVNMQADMRRDMFKKLQKLPFSYFDENETGKIMSKMTNDLMEVSELAHHGPENVFICGITVILSFIYLLTKDVMFTLIIFGCVPILIVITLVMRKKMNRAFLETRKATAVINASVESSVTGIRVTKAFTNHELEYEKFNEGCNYFVAWRKKAYKAMGQFSSSTNFITDMFNVIILIVGGFFVYYERITVTDYIAFVISISLFITPLITLINFTEQYQNGVTGFKRFLEVLDESEETDGKKVIEKFKGDLTFFDVSFEYDTTSSVLNNVSFSISAGKKIALVGPSGGGKTTICHLIPNFYKITAGHILVDGEDISNFTFDCLRGNIGIVQQDVFLFNGTVKENILYGKLDASDEEVFEAAKNANIHDYILKLEKGYDTIVGERGVKLSGGQKQRISIARVFLKNPSILILDEATSALDNTTEVLIQQALDKLCEGRTTIVVAHRLSTIKNADEILVISSGNVIERGSHKDLIELNQYYAKLHNDQFVK